MTLGPEPIEVFGGKLVSEGRPDLVEPSAMLQLESAAPRVIRRLDGSE